MRSTLRTLVLAAALLLVGGAAVLSARAQLKQDQQGKAARAVVGVDDAMVAEELWSDKGAWTSVAVHLASESIYAMDHRGKLVQMDRSGKTISTSRLKGADFGSSLRLANLAGDAEPEYVLFQRWGGDITALGRDGEALWTYPRFDGVDDVWITDLDGTAGNGLDEVVIGYNGGTGLHAVNSDGKVRWKNVEIGNVWHVTAGLPDDKGVPQVVTTSARGVLHFFSSAGIPLGQRIAPGYANLVRIANVKPGAEPVLVASVSGENDSAIAGVDRRGAQLWTIGLKRQYHVTEGAAAPNSSWFACEYQSDSGRGTVLVIDAATGRRLVTIAAGEMSSTAWLPAKDSESPVLVVVGGGKITAYRLREKKTP